MKVNDIFLQKRKQLDSLLHLRFRENKDAVQECANCGKVIREAELSEMNYICPDCGKYFPMTPRKRLELIGDIESFHELYGGWTSKNPLDFPGYEKKLKNYQNKLEQDEAVITGVIKIKGIPAAVGVMDSRFLMGSMGVIVGEKIARLAEFAAKKKLPLIIFSASGGARMQEGMFSLMQMAKTSAAIERFKADGGFYLSCLTHPTTGGVSASFANLGDIIIAEPNALICFAGPRVIEQTIGQTLPEGFQRSEFLLEHGLLDMVVEREDLQQTIARLLLMHKRIKNE